MVAKIIRDYIESGARRLTVPGFGTFMRRAPGPGSSGHDGEVIFVDLLRGDDHVLSELVEDIGGYSGLEAMALIDRFIFETKTAIDRHGRATIEGFGTMTLDPRGVFQFSYSPSARPAKTETATQERLFTPEPAKPVPTPSRPAAVPAKPARTAQPNQRTDTLLLVAIVAAAIALIALVFGMSSGNAPFLSR